jgi:uncharacterized repeat protein (TIGR01451 family)
VIVVRRVFLVAALALLATPAARAEHVPGATYTGTHSGGGTVRFTVSDDGRSVTSFGFTDLPLGCSATLTDPGTRPLLVGIGLPMETFAWTESTLTFTGSFPDLVGQTQPASLVASGTLRRLGSSNCAAGAPTVTWTATTRRVADLEVEVKDTPDPATADDFVTYVTTVQNRGPASVADATLTQRLPAGVTASSATASQGSCSTASGLVSCELGRVPFGFDVTVNVIVKATQVGALEISATAASSAEDPTPADDSTTERTTVEAPCVVPSVSAKPLAVAKRAIARAHCRTGRVTFAYSVRLAKGRVLAQRPAPGTRLASRGHVDLVVSRGRRR